MGISSLFSNSWLRQNDFQLWILGSVEKSFTDCSSVLFTTEFRFGDTASELFLYLFQGQIVYEFNEWFEIAPGYRQQFLKLPSRKWINAYDPMTDLNFKFCIENVKVINRNRIQYFFFEALPNAWQYRNRTTFIFQKKGDSSSWYPLFSEEFFFREGFGFSENRIEIGGYYSLWDIGKLHLLYLLRHQDLTGPWIQSHILRVKLEFSF